MNCVRIGSQARSSASMKKDAFYKQHAPDLMDGKSRNTILKSIKQNHARKWNAPKASSARFTILTTKEES